MATTKLSNLIIPEIFESYMIQKTAEQSNLVRSGIVVPDPRLDVLAERGGKLINMPFFNDLSGADEVISESTDLAVANIDASQDQACLLCRAKAFGATDISGSLTGTDPVGTMASLVAEYWVRREQDMLLSTLKGVFADNVANDSGDHVLNISIADGLNAVDANKISAEAIIRATALLGDKLADITAIVMHSTCYARLQEKNLIYFQPTSVQQPAFATYLGREVIIDDNVPVVAGGTSGYVYTTYLFGKGALARGNGRAKYPIEVFRQELTSFGNEVLATRRHLILHPKGVKFTANSVAGISPTNAELEMSANWDRVYQSKNIKILVLRTNG